MLETILSIQITSKNDTPILNIVTSTIKIQVNKNQYSTVELVILHSRCDNSIHLHKAKSDKW